MEFDDLMSNTTPWLKRRVVVRGRLFAQGGICWLSGTQTDAPRGDALLVDCGGLDWQLFTTTGSNPRIGGPKLPTIFDDVTVTGVLKTMPRLQGQQFRWRLELVEEVIVVGYQDRRISIDLTKCEPSA